MAMKCLLCFSDKINFVRPLAADKLIADWQASYNIDITGELGGTDFALNECTNCGLQFFEPSRPGSSALYAQLQKYPWYYMPRKWEHDVAMADIKGSKSVLEIGCGSGAFLERIAQEMDISPVGLELNDSAAAAARSKGLDIINKSLAEVAAVSAKKFDVVCSFQVLEHVPDPRLFIDQAVTLLKPGGKLIIGVPNSKSYIRRQYNLLDMPPHHMTRWSLECLRALEGLYGLKLLRVAYEQLAKYHVDDFVHTYADMLRKLPFGRLMVNRYTRPAAAFLLEKTPINVLFTGQTIYACYLRQGH